MADGPQDQISELQQQSKKKTALGYAAQAGGYLWLMDEGDGAKDERPPYVEKCRTLIVTPKKVDWLTAMDPFLRLRLGRSLGRLFGRFLGLFLIHRPSTQNHDDHARTNWTERSHEHLERCWGLEARPKKGRQ